jgi:hypothetical protein
MTQATRGQSALDLELREALGYFHSSPELYLRDVCAVLLGPAVNPNPQARGLEVGEGRQLQRSGGASRRVA